jgi:hypothetical protein
MFRFIEGERVLQPQTMPQGRPTPSIKLKAENSDHWFQKGK